LGYLKERIGLSGNHHLKHHVGVHCYKRERLSAEW